MAQARACRSDKRPCRIVGLGLPLNGGRHQLQDRQQRLPRRHGLPRLARCQGSDTLNGAKSPLRAQLLASCAPWYPRRQKASSHPSGALGAEHCASGGREAAERRPSRAARAPLRTSTRKRGWGVATAPPGRHSNPARSPMNEPLRLRRRACRRCNRIGACGWSSQHRRRSRRM